jgi:hypothetical protein
LLTADWYKNVLETVRNQFHQKSSWIADECQACQNQPDKEVDGL